MKRLLSIVVIALFTLAPVWADGPVRPAPVSITITDQKPIIEAYQRVVDANKDLQIAILRARIAVKVGEDWPIDFQTMTFQPPQPKTVEPAVKPKPEVEKPKL